MKPDYLILQSIVASVPVSKSVKRGRSTSPKSAFGRLQTFLQGRETLDGNRILIATRPHTLGDKANESRTAADAAVRPEGDYNGHVVLRSDEYPHRPLRVGYKLAAVKGSQSGRLTLSWEPSRILTGGGAQPTVIGKKTRIALPSSSHQVMSKMFALGFDFFEALHGLLSTRREALFNPSVGDTIIRIDRLAWVAVLPCREPQRVLQLLPLVFGQVISRGKGVVLLATYLGLSMKFETHSESSEVTKVVLENRQGRKKLWTLTFALEDCERNDDGEAKAGATLSGAAQGVALKIVAHPEGIANLTSMARRRLEKLAEINEEKFESVVNDFVDDEQERTAWHVSVAVWALGYLDSVDGPIRRSFADWLVPHVLREVIRLDVLANFAQVNLDRLAALDDAVVRAWKNVDGTVGSNWAVLLAEETDCTDQTIYNRRRVLLKEFGIDISIPYEFYRGLLTLGPMSLAAPESREALGRASAKGDSEKALALLPLIIIPPRPRMTLVLFFRK